MLFSNLSETILDCCMDLAGVTKHLFSLYDVYPVVLCVFVQCVNMCACVSSVFVCVGMCECCSKLCESPRD